MDGMLNYREDHLEVADTKFEPQKHRVVSLHRGILLLKSSQKLSGNSRSFVLADILRTPSDQKTSLMGNISNNLQ